MNRTMGFGLLAAMAFGCGVADAPSLAPAVPPGGAGLAASPQAFSFGDVPVGTSTTRDVTLSNTGMAAAQITDVTVTGPGFSATGMPVPLTLAPGASTTVTVGFAPPATGTFTGDVILASAALDLVVIAPTGTGVTGGTPPAASIDSVTVNPATVAAGEAVQMTAVVAATGDIDKSVTWSLESGSLGSIDPVTGVYTAPSTAGDYTVTATSVAKPIKKGSGKVKVNPSPPAASIDSVTVNPASVAVGKSVQMTVTVAATGTIDKSVTWAVATGSLGSIDAATGVYTAPSATGSYMVTATSVADGSKKGSGTVTVTPTVSITVRTYGAVGDGVQDDTAAFQAAANAAVSAGTDLIIPAPSVYYRLTGVVNVSSSVIGVGNPLIRMDGANGAEAKAIFKIKNYQGNGVIFSGLHLDGGWNGGTAGEGSHLIFVQGSKNITVENCTLENAYGDGVSLGGEVGTVQVENVIVRYNQILNPYRCAVALINAAYVTINDNYIKKLNNYVGGVDLEPDYNGTDFVTHVDIIHNHLEMGPVSALVLYQGPAPALGGSYITASRNWGSVPWGFWFQVGSGWSQISIENGLPQRTTAIPSSDPG